MAKRKHGGTYPPLKLLKEVTHAIPDAWEKMDFFHRSNGDPDCGTWASWCYAPMGAACAVVPGVSMDMDAMPVEVLRMAQKVSALAPWRISKEVFLLDHDLAEMLVRDTDEMTIPAEVLLRLPYQCFYIETDAFYGFHGFFAHLEDDLEDHDPELRILMLTEAGEAYGFPLHINAGNTVGSMARMVQQGERYTDRTPDFLEEDQQMFLSMTRGVLQIILYILARNSEVGEYTPEVPKAPPARIRDRFSEIRIRKVGTRTGAAIREWKRSTPRTAADREEEGMPAYAPHRPPRPHVRRAHWHSYWVGPKNSPERHVEVYWIPPLVIGAAQGDPAGEGPRFHLVSGDGE